MLIGSSFDDWAVYNQRLEECGGVLFDLKGCAYGLEPRICNKRSPCPDKVILYARMGLHRYNLLQGTKFQLTLVKKYVVSRGSPAASYYITLDAMDPACVSSLQTFQTQVSEKSCGKFILMCDIARIREETAREVGPMNLRTRLPEWPTENPFEKYYLLKESELRDNDWIRLYVQLAVAMTDIDRNAKNYGPSNLEIVNVAMDVEPPNDEGLNAKNAIFYIRYKDLYQAGLGRDPDRIVMVRREFDEYTDCFSLKGQNQSSSRWGLGLCKPFADKLNLTGLPNQTSSPLATTREDHEVANQHAVNSRD